MGRRTFHHGKTASPRIPPFYWFLRFCRRGLRLSTRLRQKEAAETDYAQGDEGKKSGLHTQQIVMTMLNRTSSVSNWPANTDMAALIPKAQRLSGVIAP